jgi:ketosteroid isomerase-like protein
MERLAATWQPTAMSDPATAVSWTELFSPDVVLVEPPSLPHGGRHAGIEAFAAAQAGMRELWEQRIEDAAYWLCGPDRACVRIVITWTARSTGRRVTLPMIDLISFGDGAITAIEAFVFDTAALLATLDGAPRGARRRPGRGRPG